MAASSVAPDPASNPLVIDASVTVAWCFPEEQGPFPQSVLDRLPECRAVVPPLWSFEIANVFLIAERRGRSTRADTQRWLQLVGSLPITVDAQSGAEASRATLDLARRHALSVYAAAYLELALRRNGTLATLDRRLRAAAELEGIVVL